MIEPLGRGGMGAVYRAKDRLGGHVALKRIITQRERHWGSLAAAAQLAEPYAATITVTSEMISGVSPVDSRDDLFSTIYGTAEAGLSGTQAAGDADAIDASARLALAREFRVLASLRHPNIISVLDYGFDEELFPYYTMELLERPDTIVEAGRGQSFAARLGLLAEALHALVYLHRRGVIHRDVKPANVMVEAGRVKLLDFGIATIREELGDGFDGMGTLAYLAPEVLCFEPATELSDLYAVGLIAYELFAARHPFASSVHDPSRLRTDILGQVPDLEGIDERLAPVIGRLLAKNPAHRYASASEVLGVLREVSGVPLPLETAATRESFLQAAELVGRDQELVRLSDLLLGARAGHGAAVLLGGESGVGKSRLLEELRAHALVEGVVVLRGQCVSEGGAPLHPFRDVLRWLALLVDLDDYEAGVLKTVVPDIGAVLEREVPEAPALATDATQIRLFNVIEDLLRRQRQPALLVLEDLHWAPSESLKLLARICSAVQGLKVLVVGSYRDDERPELPRELSMMNTLRIGRLPRRGIEALSASMLGDAGSRPELVDLLARETEGNPFFLVEVVRALAEEAGELGRVGNAPLPARVGAGGLQRIVQRRIERVPVAARPLLLVAAVLGRQIDPALLGVIAPEVDLEEWLATCVSVAVLEPHEGSIRFAHDKLREALLSALAPEEGRALHRKAALAIEVVHQSSPEHVPALALHWGAAGDEQRESHYAVLAGEQALRNGAYTSAITHLSRALELLTPAEEPSRSLRLFDALARLAGLERTIDAEDGRFRRGQVEGQLARAYYHRGDMKRAQHHGESALRLLGLPMPSTLPGFIATLPQQILLRTVQSLTPSAFVGRTEAERAVFREATGIQSKLTGVWMFEQKKLPALWSGLRMLNIGERGGPSQALVESYALMSMVLGATALRPIGLAWAERAAKLSVDVSQHAEALVWARKGIFHIYVGEWDRAAELFERAIAMGERIGDVWQWEEGTTLLANVRHYQGNFALALGMFLDVLDVAQRNGHRQVQWWGTLGVAQSSIRLGKAHLVLETLEGGREEFSRKGLEAYALTNRSLLSLAHLYTGDHERALAAGHEALELMHRGRPSAYWNQQSAAALVEIFLTLWEESRRKGRPSREQEALVAAAQKACKGLSAYGRAFPFARPFEAVWEGEWHRLSGRAERARQSFRAGLEMAERMHMHYELGLAHLGLGRTFGRYHPAGQRHLALARDHFQRLGAARDLDLARAALEERESASPPATTQPARL